MHTRFNAVRTRRQFLQQLSTGAAAVVGGVALGACAKAAEAPANPALPGGRKLGVALVGLGSYATEQLAPALLQTKNCQLAGVVSGSPEKARRWARQYHLPERSLYNYETMVDIAHNPDIDIVYIVTPVGLHAEHVIRAAQTGKHVISEKPMAGSVAECDAMIAACKAAGVKLSIGYRLHFDPLHVELKRLAQEKTYGPFMRMTGANGFRMGSKVWRATRALAGGGPLMDMGIYCVQEACLAADATPVAVTAREHTKTRPDFFTDVEQGLDWTMEFANGAKAELSTSYDQNYGRFRAEAEKGWLHFEPAFGYRGLKVMTHNGPLNLTPLQSQQAVQMDDFALCVRENRESRIPGEMGRRDMAIIDAIYAAMKTGKRTEVKA